MLAQVEAVKNGEIDELRDRLQTEGQAAKVARDLTYLSFVLILMSYLISKYSGHISLYIFEKNV